MAAAPQHARVENRTVVVMFDGRWQRDTSLAWSEWVFATHNPFNSPVLTARAHELRAALDEVGYLKQEIAA